MTTTHLDALKAIHPLRYKLQRRIIRQFDAGNHTADEIAQRLGISILTARPRVAELVKRGYLQDSGQRRQNASGRTAAVWEIKKDDQQYFPLVAFTTTKRADALNAKGT